MVISKNNQPHSHQVIISRASEADVDIVYGILEKATEWLALQGMQHWNGVHRKERILADFEKGHVLIAKLPTEEFVGTVTISFVAPWYHETSDQGFWHDSAAPAAYILKLAVVPNHMKKGIAAQLLSAAEQDALQSGAQYARGDTNPAFPKLVSYYLNRGYTKRGERAGNSYFEKKLAKDSSSAL